MRFPPGLVVVITGAGSGIGRATALAFASRKARVYLVDIREDRLTEVKKEIEKDHGLAFVKVVDCTSPETLKSLAAEIYEVEGRVDVLHNNAGVGHMNDIQKTSIADWEWVMNLNFYGVVYGVEAFLPFMLKQESRANIFNTASMAGLLGFPRMAPYCASKFAVVGLSESLNAELADQGVSVTAICPGLIKTNISADGRMNYREGNANIFDRFGGSPEKVAKKIVSLVGRSRSVQTVASGTYLLWLIKRLSHRMFSALLRRSEARENKKRRQTQDLS
ncbi:MAG: SDR family NAD(P)-dependent oxidoreductase [Planctomycetota bacterium]|nr:SDR family NAD(P)-dependent oxidoreductase [Planctomycetota bacterium]